MNEQFVARIAEAYGRHSEKYTPILEPILKPMADEMVSLVDLKGGEAVLDLATGTGLIARAVGELTQGILGIDISFGVLASAWILSAGMIPFVAGDVHRLPFMDKCFDLVMCGLSLSHFSDVQRALKDIRRVLRPRGRFITSAWGSEGNNPSKAAAIEVRRRFLNEREITFGGTFNEEIWADVTQGCGILRQAGFAEVQVKTLPLSGKYRNTSEAVETVLAWPITRYRIAQLDPVDQKRLRQETAAAILEIDDLRWQTEIHYYQAAQPG